LTRGRSSGPAAVTATLPAIIRPPHFTRAIEEAPVPELSHPLDQISLGKIVVIREQLMDAAASGVRVYRFESGDPSFDIAPHVLTALKKAAEEGRTHYVPNSGIPELRTALAEKIRTKNGIADVTAADIFVTNGAMHALFVTFSALLLPGEEVIVPDPMWTEVVENIRLAGGVPVAVPLSAEDDFVYRPEAIEAAITPATRAIFLNTPHNPTGAVMSEPVMRRILEIARSHSLWIISDEAYVDVVYAPARHVSMASLAPDHAHRIVSIFSFSKSHAMSGLRTGYIVTRDRVLQDRIPKLLRCTINGVNSVAQWAALAAVTGDTAHLERMREEYEVRRGIMVDALTGIDGVRPFTPRGTFFLWVELDPAIYARLGVASADEFSELLASRGIGSAPGDAFGEGCADAIRFAFSCSTEMVREGSPVLRSILAGEPA
jgi:aspartate aminotransferase